ncbi:MAG TPA: Crp/Fnr family transcriptional regulator [Chthonomonadaceae bacterium]|nr:Crp/Fnr family transcriptional regulator [Chthonomonadaceae bacterium]
MPDTGGSTTALLRQVSFFAELDEALLQQLAGHTRRRKYPAKEPLFRQGDPGYTLYIVLSGRVQIETMTASGETVHIANRGPGEHFGELALIDGKPRMADAVTASPCELLMLDRTEFIRCVEASPRIALGVMASLAERLRQAADHLASRQELDVLGRVSEALLGLAAAHGVAEPSGGKRIAVPITRQQLAEQTGTTRESVSRALSSLKAVQALDTDGRQLIVLNEKKLRQYAGK